VGRHKKYTEPVKRRSITLPDRLWELLGQDANAKLIEMLEAPEERKAMAFNSDDLNKANIVRHLLEAAEALDQAGQFAVACKSDPLFKHIHEQRMELWGLVCNIMQGQPLTEPRQATTEATQ
jgi:hypothetical protein